MFSRERRSTSTVLPPSQLQSKTLNKKPNVPLVSQSTNKSKIPQQAKPTHARNAFNQSLKCHSNKIDSQQQFKSQSFIDQPKRYSAQSKSSFGIQSLQNVTQSKANEIRATTLDQPIESSQSIFDLLNSTSTCETLDTKENRRTSVWMLEPARKSLGPSKRPTQPSHVSNTRPKAKVSSNLSQLKQSIDTRRLSVYSKAQRCVPSQATSVRPVSSYSIPRKHSVKVQPPQIALVNKEIHKNMPSTSIIQFPSQNRKSYFENTSNTYQIDDQPKVNDILIQTISTNQTTFKLYSGEVSTTPSTVSILPQEQLNTSNVNGFLPAVTISYSNSILSTRIALPDPLKMFDLVGESTCVLEKELNILNDLEALLLNDIEQMEKI